MSTLAATDGLAEALARIASSLRVPVLFLALLVLLVCAFEVGRFAIELFSRARAGRGSLRGSSAKSLPTLGRPPASRLARPARLPETPFLRSPARTWQANRRASSMRLPTTSSRCKDAWITPASSFAPVRHSA